MSGTLIPLAARGIDPTAAYQAYNEMLRTGAQIPLTQSQTGKTQAETGLIGQQTIGAGIQNQLSGLSLDIQKQLYGPLMGAGAAQPQGPLPWDTVRVVNNWNLEVFFQKTRGSLQM